MLAMSSNSGIFDIWVSRNLSIIFLIIKKLNNPTTQLNQFWWVWNVIEGTDLNQLKRYEFVKLLLFNLIKIIMRIYVLASILSLSNRQWLMFKYRSYNVEWRLKSTPSFFLFLFFIFYFIFYIANNKIIIIIIIQNFQQK